MTFRQPTGIGPFGLVVRSAAGDIDELAVRRMLGSPSAGVQDDGTGYGNSYEVIPAEINRHHR